MWAAIGLSLAVPFAFLLAAPRAVDAAVRDDGVLPRQRWVWLRLALVPLTLLSVMLTPVVVKRPWIPTRLLSAREVAVRAAAWVVRVAPMVWFIAGACRLGTEIDAYHQTVGRDCYLI